MIKTGLKASIVAGCLVLFFHVTLHAATLSVCSSGCDYTTIQDAVNGASAGDIITIDDPVHTEQGIVVTKSVTIHGQGQSSTIVQAHADPGQATDRVFTIDSGVTVVLRDMTIRHGNIPSSNNPKIGGGILTSADQLSLERVTVRNNSITSDSYPTTQLFGGGIYNNFDGSLSIVDSSVLNNQLFQYDSMVQFYGGGIYSRGNLSIESSTISSNICNGANCMYPSTGQGAGIYQNGSFMMSNSSISNNEMYVCHEGLGSYSCCGGGIFLEGTTATISDSSIHGNYAENSGFGDYVSRIAGGGIFTEAGITLFIQNSKISGNSIKSGIDGGFSPQASGGGIYNAGSLFISGTSIYSNNALGGDSGSSIDGPSCGKGGGLYNDGIVEMTNCTVSANAAKGGDSTALEFSFGEDGYGGGLYIVDQTTLIASTIVFNSSIKGVGDSVDGMEYGGGIYVEGYSLLTIDNCIIAQNSAQHFGPDVYGAVQSDDYNFIQETNDCSISGTTIHNIYGQDPLLGPLQNNGGFTLTHALLDGSPAIDAGSCSVSGVTEDQRGYMRPWDIASVPNVDDGCDMGSFEKDASVPTLSMSAFVSLILLFSFILFPRRSRQALMSR